MATATKPGAPGGAGPGTAPRQASLVLLAAACRASWRSPSPALSRVAQRYPQYASKITAAAKSAFLSGDQWAYTAAIIGVVLGAALVFFMFPRQEAELALLARYQAEDRQ